VLHLRPGDVIYYPCHTPHRGAMRLDDSVKLHLVQWDAGPDDGLPTTACMAHDTCGRIYSALTWMHARWCAGDANSLGICEVLLQAVIAEFRQLAATEALPAGDPIARALHWLQTNIAFPSADLSRLLASEAEMSPVQLRRAFKRATGETPLECQRRLRVEAALPLIQHSDLVMEEIAHRVGLYDASHLWRLVVQHLGRSPHDLRSAARQMQAAPSRCPSSEVQSSASI
jgi:transcriptional regulator GlxA family with amidase domain